MPQPPVPIAEGIWAIQVPLPSPRNPVGFSYVIEDGAGDVHLIDAGLNDEASRAELDRGLSELGRTFGDVRSVTVTHLHRDHVGVADAVRAESGAIVAMLDAEANALGAMRRTSDEELASWDVPSDRRPALLEVLTVPPDPIAVDLRLRDGDVLPIPGRDIVALHTPGHTPGHACYVSERERLLFTGDHLLPDQFPGIGLGGPTATNPLRDYRASLARVRAFDGYRALPGHGWLFDTIGARVDETLAHHARRTAGVADILERQPDASIWTIATQLRWSNGFDRLSGVFLLSALRQTQWHVELVVAGES